MIEHPSLMFAYEVVDHIAELDDEEQSAKADLLVETFRDHEISGLMVTNVMTNNRVTISIRASDRRPKIVYGSVAHFDPVSGRVLGGGVTVVYRHKDPETIASLCMDFLIRSRPVWIIGHNEEESE